MERQWKYIRKRLKLRLRNARGIWLLQISPTRQKHTIPTSLAYASVLQRVSCSLWRSLRLSKWPVPRCKKMKQSEIKQQPSGITNHKALACGTMLIYVVHYMIFDLCWSSVYFFFCVHAMFTLRLAQRSPQWAGPIETILATITVVQHWGWTCRKGECLPPFPYLSCLFTVLGIWLTCFIPLQSFRVLSRCSNLHLTLHEWNCATNGSTWK